MDGTRFDAMAKAVAEVGADRRTFLRRLAGGALGVALGGAALDAGAYCPRGVAGRKKNCCRRESEPCRDTHQCCNGRCEENGGSMQCGACFNIGAPCEEGADCCTFICAGRRGQKICANA